MENYPVIDGVLTIPEGVKVINNSEFHQRLDIVKVVLPSSVTTISKAAFGNCENLESINIPESVNLIGDRAFGSCSSLKAIHIPAATEVGKDVFHLCPSLSSITVAEGNPHIDSREGCNAIIETATDTLIYGCSATVVPSGVKAIEEKAFYFCSTLKSITLPEGLTKIGASAFVGCKNLETVTLPKGLKTIGESAFSFCDSLKGVEIPSTVTSIGRDAFANCFCLTKLNIPAATVFDPRAFRGCGAIESISVDGNHPIYDNREGCNAIIETKTDVLLKGCSSTVIPESVKEIGDNAFQYCKGLETINIPQTVMAIGYSAFAGSGIRKITLPDTLTVLSDSMFADCEHLESVEIPQTVTEIGRYAFRGCASLTNIKLPKNLVKLGGDAFKKCSSLKAIEIPAGVQKISSGHFEGCPSLASITFPDGSEVFDTAEGVNSVIEKASGKLVRGCNGTVIPESVTSIEGSAFCDSVLSNLTIPKSVSRMGYGSFRRCTILESISVEEGNPTFDSRSGSNAIIETATDTLLHGFGVTVIPEGVKTIGEYSFSHCQNLTEINIPVGVKKIDTRAFQYCVNLKTVTLPAGVGKIDEMTFDGCDALECINVPSGKLDFYMKRLPESLHAKLVELPKPSKKK